MVSGLSCSMWLQIPCLTTCIPLICCRFYGPNLPFLTRPTSPPRLTSVLSHHTAYYLAAWSNLLPCTLPLTTVS
ncbi:hypothetical protein V8C86DRAFT_2798625, partial [Haematococcus lacustris]